MALPVDTASNQLMNVRMVREVTIWLERYGNYVPRLGAVRVITKML
jgi:hypothetical protein